MHPILGERRRLLIYLFVWQLLGLLLTLGLREDASWLVAAAFFLPLSTVYAFVCLTAWYVCRAFPIDAVGNIWNLLLAHVAAAAVASMLLLVSGLGWALTLDAFGTTRRLAALRTTARPAVRARHAALLAGHRQPLHADRLPGVARRGDTRDRARPAGARGGAAGAARADRPALHLQQPPFHQRA